MLLNIRAKAQLKIINNFVNGFHVITISYKVFCVTTESYSMPLAEVTGSILFTITFCLKQLHLHYWAISI